MLFCKGSSTILSIVLFMVLALYLLDIPQQRLIFSLMHGFHLFITLSTTSLHLEIILLCWMELLNHKKCNIFHPLFPKALNHMNHVY